MATSTILESVKITDPKETEAFINALEESEKNLKSDVLNPSYEFVTNPEEIRKILNKKYLN